MPLSQQLLPIEIPDAGATVTLEGLRTIDLYVIELTQTGTMSGNTSITGDGFTTTGCVYNIEFPGGMTLGAQTCTIFGKALTAQQALTPCRIVARYDGAAYQTQIYTDWSTSNNVTTAQILADAVVTSKILDANVTWAKLQALARGSTLRGSATNIVEALALASGRFPLGDGTDVTAGVMSADATLAGTGALTIANNAITNAKILDATITLAKLEALNRGNMIRGSSTNRPEAYNVATIGAGAMVMTDIVSQLMSGDATLSGAGALTISLGLNVYVSKVLIPTASVLTGNTIPVAIVAAQGAGKIIDPLACIETLTFNTTPYATNGTSQLRHNTATDACMNLGSSFLFGTKTALMSNVAINAVTDTQLLANQALMWEVGTGDPTAGDSSVTVYVVYRVIDA